MVKLSYFNLLSIFDGSTCYCPDCIGERFSIFTPEETTEVVETVSSGAGEQVFEKFREVLLTAFDYPLLKGIVLLGVLCFSFSLIMDIFRRILNE